MNPETNRFEQLSEADEDPGSDENLAALRRMVQRQSVLVRPNGEPVPDHWVRFRMDELVTIKGYTFRVKYLGETSMLVEPAGFEPPESSG